MFWKTFHTQYLLQIFHNLILTIIAKNNFNINVYTQFIFFNPLTLVSKMSGYTNDVHL